MVFNIHAMKVNSLVDQYLQPTWELHRCENEYEIFSCPLFLESLGMR